MGFPDKVTEGQLGLPSNRLEESFIVLETPVATVLASEGLGGATRAGVLLLRKLCRCWTGVVGMDSVPRGGFSIASRLNGHQPAKTVFRDACPYSTS